MLYSRQPCGADVAVCAGIEHRVCRGVSCHLPHLLGEGKTGENCGEGVALHAVLDADGHHAVFGAQLRYVHFATDAHGARGDESEREFRVC